MANQVNNYNPYAIYYDSETLGKYLSHTNWLFSTYEPYDSRRQARQTTYQPDPLPAESED